MAKLKPFVTQEIGSIQRPIWRQKLDAPVNAEWVADALAWGERLDVNERDELANPGKTGLLQKDGATRSPEEKKRIIDIASIYVIRMFEKAGLDRVYNGEQPRTEMYDSLARLVPGIQTAGQVNSFDANYFRKGILEDELSIPAAGVKWFVDEFNFVKQHTNRIVKPCLTGPYTMTDWSYVEHYRAKNEKKGQSAFDALNQGRHDSVLAFATDVLNPICRALATAGASVVQIDEPAAATDERESALFTQSMNASFEGLPSNVEKAIHLCYSTYSWLFPQLAECVADSYLIEFTNHGSTSAFAKEGVNPEAYKLIELFEQHGLPVSIGVGVVDIHSDVVEAPELIRDRLLYAAELVSDATRVQVNPDCGLRTRRWDVAYAKLCNLVKGAELARDAL